MFFCSIAVLPLRWLFSYRILKTPETKMENGRRNLSTRLSHLLLETNKQTNQKRTERDIENYRGF